MVDKMLNSSVAMAIKITNNNDALHEEFTISQKYTDFISEMCILNVCFHYSPTLIFLETCVSYECGLFNSIEFKKMLLYIFVSNTEIEIFTNIYPR